MKRLVALGIMAVLFAVAARADGVAGGVGNEGTSYGVGQPSGISYKIGGGSAPPTTCTGTIDLSTGCAQPMLGGL